MKAYREFILQAPEDVSGFFAFLTVPPVPSFPENLHGKKMCASSGVAPRHRKEPNR